ncbi:hypothetical protein OOK31_28440 [Streptomyces sp. NBC_00249]|uniref:hypothetical protein n=1 Tax=Streptomyces sp. NBC_00249 TaxID=2975690 RepID=UPI00224FA20C|nr:hypothetical protein [Streptomyces sp. NBC_00249]MCX5197778.1 hypothetical protein [Streptomyces sp. NBC_00249]
MSGASERRWAQLAREAEFTQLGQLRRQAEGWRTALTGLTGLLAVLTVVKGPDTLAGATASVGVVATVMVVAAYVLLLGGMLLAARAAHGRPGEDVLLAGQALRRWTGGEVVRVTRSLRWAAVGCVAGVALAAGALVLLWATADPPARNLVRVTTDQAEVCGELLRADQREITVGTGKGPVKNRHVLPQGRLVSLVPVQNCD